MGPQLMVYRLPKNILKLEVLVILLRNSLVPRLESLIGSPLSFDMFGVEGSGEGKI